jgi:hypothetical protein
MAQAGGGTLIVCALRTHAGQEHVVEWGLKALGVLAAGTEAVKVCDSPFGGGCHDQGLIA